MATIKDVAQDAGVSVGTVSNVLNGGRVGEERRQRVEESIRRLGYQVNGLARGLRTQRTDYVVLILPNISNPFYSTLLQDLERELALAGKYPLLCISEGNPEKEIRYLKMAKNNKVDGIIGVSFSDVEEYVDESMAVVSIERHFPQRIPCVACDNFLGGQLAAENLVRRGATELLFLQTISSVESEVSRRRDGFEEYCIVHGIPYSSVSISENQVSSVFSAFSARGVIHNVLKVHMEETVNDRRPNGVFAGADHLAVVVMEELRAMGYRVPEDVQLIGYDGLRVMNSGGLFVSSIYQDTRAIAEAGVDCLIRLLNGEQVESVMDLPVRFMEGGTTLGLRDPKQSRTGQASGWDSEKRVRE